MNASGPLSVSVVLPTFNRAGILCRVLPSYLASPLAGEVVIVDDAGTDDTRQQLSSFMAQDPRLLYVRNERNLGLPASRNRGARQATGQWILQSEDDLALGEGCLEVLRDHALKTGADVIAGRRIWMRLGESQEQALVRANRCRARPFRERLMDINSHALTPDDIELPLLNATMLVRREVLKRVQYHPPFGGPSSWREESDFQLSALEQGFKLVFCPHAVAFHYSRASQSFGPSRLAGTAAYAYRVYRNNLLFLRRHQDYLQTHYPHSLLLGSPQASALVYGLYRAAWLLAAEGVRAWRARRHGAFSWQ